MLTVILLIVAVIALIGWLSCWCSSAALVKFMIDKGYTPPSDEEAKAYSTYALKKFLHIR